MLVDPVVPGITKATLLVLDASRSFITSVSGNGPEMDRS